MKNYLLVVVLMLVTVTQFGCATPPANTPPTNANVAVPEATPDKAAIEAELIKIENDWPRIIRERDGAAVRRVESDDFFVIYPDGQTGGKDQDIKDIEAGSMTADSWEITDLKVNVLSKDVAVVSLRNTVKNGKFKSADGKSNDISGQYRSVDTFARRNGQWQLVASATVPVRVPVVSPSPTPGASPSPGASPGTKPSPAAKGTPAAKPSPAARTSPVTRPAATPAKVAPKPVATP
jgi:ketosteroid isomerase-like protein